MTEQQRQYLGDVIDHWQIGIYQERGLLSADAKPTWENVAAACNEYYGFHPDSPRRLHVDEHGNAYRLPTTEETAR